MNFDNQISHIDFIKNLNKEKLINGEAFSYSLANENFGCLEYVIENNYSQPPSVKNLISNVILTFTDENEICKCIDFLYSKNFEGDNLSYKYAIEKGYLKVVKSLIKNGCSLSEDCCGYAGLFGNLEILKHLHEKGCPWDYKTYSNILTWSGKNSKEEEKINKFNCLTYAYSNNCPVENNSNSINQLKYDIYKKRTPIDYIDFLKDNNLYSEKEEKEFNEEKN